LFFFKKSSGLDRSLVSTPPLAANARLQLMLG
jgi:hypothetical protein